MTLDGVVRDSDPISENEAARLFNSLYGERALVLAVSGGPDSTALLWLAARWCRRIDDGPKLIAVTIDHGLRKDSAREAMAVKRLAKELGVEHRTLRWTGPKPKTGIPAAARDARYRLLSKVAHASGSRTVLTAHTLDDQAETILLRMARGSGLAGLAGMGWLSAVPVPEGRGLVLIRCLLEVPKARLIATLEAAKIPYAVDPSNVDPRFTRPRIRALMPLLAREGLTAARLGKLAKRIARVEGMLFEAVNQAQFTLCPKLPPDGPTSMDVEAFFELPDEIGVRLLQRLVQGVVLHGLGTPAELGQFETLYDWLRVRAGGSSGRVRRTLAGTMVTLSGNKLTVERAPPRRTGAKTGKHGGKPLFTKPR